MTNNYIYPLSLIRLEFDRTIIEFRSGVLIGVGSGYRPFRSQLGKLLRGKLRFGPWIMLLGTEICTVLVSPRVEWGFRFGFQKRTGFRFTVSLYLFWVDGMYCTVTDEWELHPWSGHVSIHIYSMDVHTIPNLCAQEESEALVHQSPRKASRQVSRQVCHNWRGSSMRTNHSWRTRGEGIEGWMEMKWNPWWWISWVHIIKYGLG
jgi:hypothetical protein